MTNEILKLLDFSEWTVFEMKDVRPFSNDELAEMEGLLTNASDEMSQLDHVRMVITYKSQIAKLEEVFHIALRLMFEEDDANRRVFLARMARRYPTPEIVGLSKKYEYDKSILRKSASNE